MNQIFFFIKKIRHQFFDITNWYVIMISGFWLLFYLVLMHNCCVILITLRILKNNFEKTCFRTIARIFKVKLCRIYPFESTSWKEPQTFHRHTNYSHLSTKYIFILVFGYKISNTYCWHYFIYQKYKKLHLSYLFQRICTCQDLK